MQSALEYSENSLQPIDREFNDDEIYFNPSYYPSYKILNFHYTLRFFKICSREEYRNNGNHSSSIQLRLKNMFDNENNEEIL